MHGFLVTRGEGAQGVLHAVAQLRQHAVRNIQRVLRDEIHAHALRAREPHNQLDAFEQYLGRVFKQQMGFVKEKHHFGRGQVADFRQAFIQLRQHPQQKGGVQARRVQQFVGGQNIDHALTTRGLHHVGDIEHRLAKELIAALFFNLQQGALDGADRGGADIAVAGGEFPRIVGHGLAHGAQVLHVQQRQLLVVSNLEDQLQHTRLYLV